jgi:hypothetical protein
VLALTAAAPLPDRGVFRWQFEVGRFHVFEQVTDTEQEISVMGQQIKQTQLQVARIRLTPLRAVGAGRWLLGLRIEGMKLEIDIGGQKTSFDSDTPNPGGPLADLFKALVGADLQLDYDRARGVIGVGGREELLKRLAKVDANLRPVLEAAFSEHALKELGAQLLPPLPIQRARTGDSWDRRSATDLGPIGRYTSTTKFTYAGLDAGRERYRVEVLDFRHTAPEKAAGQAQLPFQIKASDLKGKGAGEIVFDRERGRLERAEQRLTMEGSLTIDIGGNETKIDLKQQQTVTVRPRQAERK